MRIAFCVIKGISYAGGIERYMLEVIPHLVFRGHEITVYSMGHYGDVPSYVAGARIVKVACIRGGSFEKISASASAACSTAIFGKHDIVHFHHISAGWAALLPRLRGQRCVLQSHGIAWRCSKWTGFGKTVLKACERLAVRSCHALTVVSHSQVEYYRSTYGVAATFIPTGVSKPQVSTAREIHDLGLSSKSYILYVGRLSREKGVHDLIRAFKRIREDIRLVIAGGAGEAEYHKELMQLAACDKRVMLLGEVKGRRLAELYSNAWVYVQPSELEGMSLSLLEAMSYGRCCLVSNIPENVSVVGDAGVTFEANNADSLAQRLGMLIGSSELVERKGVLAEQYARTLYSWESVAERLDDFYSVVRESDGDLKYAPTDRAESVPVP